MFEAGAELKQKFGADKVFDFSIGNPDVPPPAVFYEVYRQVCLSAKPEHHSYMANNGYYSTRQKLAAHLSDIYNVSVKPENLVITTGAAGALNIAIKSIVNANDEIIIVAPYFVEYKFYIDNHNAKTVVVESDIDFNLDISKISAALTEKTRAIIINSPNNPTGKIYSRENLVELAKLLNEHSRKIQRPIFILSDEPYRSIVYENKEMPSICEIYENTIIANSYSKEFSLPGERIGYALINPRCAGAAKLADALTLCNRICGFVNAPATMQRVIEQMLTARVDVDIYKKRRDIFYNGLKEIGYTLYKPEGAFYLFVKSPLADDVAFVQRLLDYNILAVPGIGFGRAGYFRLAYCVNEQIIQSAMPCFKKAIENL